MEYNNMHIDVLRELANIGSGNAATALSQMLGQSVEIAIPEVGIVGFNEAIEKLGGAEMVNAGLLLTLSGDVTGMMMYLMPREFSCKIINTLMFANISDFSEIDEMGFSAISEMVNIMSGSFVRAIADMTKLFIDISPPFCTIDMLAAMFSVPAIYFAGLSDKVILVKNEITIAGEKSSGSIIMLPETDSLEKMMASLGIVL